ncbi:MAG: phenylalanine--tRNA ligase subunit beta, partial [Bacteroidota bacterium]
MKISLNWLKEYIDFRESPEELSQLLTHCGLEVEALEPIYGSGVQLDGLVVGHVVECAKHPNADKLSVTRVDIGGIELLKIVCGAPNVAAGQKVVVAKVGTTLNTAKGELTLSKVKIRGEESEGMICAEDEIGLGNSHEGIIVLDNAAVIGSGVGEYLGAIKDYTYEIGLTPNRADATSHTGVARDIAAVLSLKNPVKIKMPSVEDFLVDNNDKVIPVIIEDAEACPRYCGITVSGITVGESPVWLKEKLMAIGLHPINNVVDISNFILHELGQPLHA